MKCTPQKAITSLGGRGRLLREAERVAHEVGDVLDLGQLVVVGEDHGAALAGQRAHLGLHGGDVRRAGAGSWRGLQEQGQVERRRGVGQRAHRHVV